MYLGTLNKDNIIHSHQRCWLIDSPFLTSHILADPVPLRTNIQAHPLPFINILLSAACQTTSLTLLISVVLQGTPGRRHTLNRIKLIQIIRTSVNPWYARSSHVQQVTPNTFLTSELVAALDTRKLTGKADLA